MMKKIIIGLLLLQASYCIYGASSSHQAVKKVVFLKGTGCAGKTNLGVALNKIGWQLIDEDGWYYERYPEFCKSLCPGEFVHVERAIEYENLLHAVMRNQILFKKEATEVKREQAIASIKVIQAKLNERTPENIQIRTDWHYKLRADICAAIEQAVSQGPVVLDSWFLKPEQIQSIRDRFPSLTVLVYVPFAELVNRTIKRNTAALLDGKYIYKMRFFHQALISFTYNFELSANPEDSVDVLTKTDFMHACDIVNLCLSNSPLATGATSLATRGEFSIESFKEYSAPILAAFGERDRLYVKPKIAYDHFIRTDKCDSDQAALQIEKLSLS